jgi:hypothetical protein
MLTIEGGSVIGSQDPLYGLGTRSMHLHSHPPARPALEVALCGDNMV